MNGIRIEDSKMDFSSVVKTDLSVRNTLDAKRKSLPSAPEASKVHDSKDAPVNEAKKVDVSSALSALNKTNAWKQESVSDKAAERSTLRANESEQQSRIRQMREEAALEDREEQIEEARDKAKEVIDSLNMKQVALRFDTAEDYDNARVINVVDAKSNEVIRQIPSEEFLRISAAIAKYEQRIAHDEMTQDPSLKAYGVDSKNVNESLRGAVLETTA